MPTPATAARQCLTEEAARALDEAVAVARRRSHAQTTSLHAVSALLSLPSSTLRDACARARSSAYPSRLQFRALELCVGVSLDRLPSSKTVEDPPISNSLMAAIKRSQANQRRHPESYHLQQLHSNNNNNNNATGCSQTASLLKVELKYFILSILDDPIVSRVFGEAGFRSCDIKLALVHPPVTQVSPRFSRTRCPPIFLCNLTDSVSGRAAFNFPFPGQEDGVDENCGRIGEVMVKKSGKSPLLVGVCAIEALRGFTESLARGKSGFLDGDLAGLNVISIENEVNELVIGGNEEKLGIKLKETEGVLEKCNGFGGGVVLNFGDLKGLILDGVLSDSVSALVLKLTGLMEVYRRKLWLIGAVASVEMYRKFSDKFPNIEKDWDLQLLPITSSKSSFDGVCSKSSLMGSFVPFGGFFPTTSDLRSPLSGRNQSIPRCKLCNEKYELEVAAILKGGSTASVADQYSENLPSWLRMAAVDTTKGADVTKTKDGETMLNAKVSGLQRKWNDICRRLHHTSPFHKLDITSGRSLVPIVEVPQFATDKKQSSGEDLSISESRFPDQSSSTQMQLQKIFPPKRNIPIPCSEAENINVQSRLLADVSSLAQQTDMDVPWFTHHPQPNLSSCPGRTPLFVPPVTTDLKLGTIYASTSQESNTTKSLDHKSHLQHFSGSISADANSENTSYQFAQSSSCSGLTSGEHFDQGGYKSIRKVLSEKVGWQDEAVNSVSQAVSHLRSRYGSRSGINPKGDIWLTFLGPDRVGKRRIALALAEVLFGSQENLISVDLSMQDKGSHSNSIFECQELNGYDVKFRGKTVSDFIAEELRKKPHSVIFLENVHKADYYVQRSLDQAIRTGKFPDSHGREISLNNTVLIMSAIRKGNINVLCEKKSMKFSEERILGAKRWQMQIVVGSVSDDVSRSNDTNTRVAIIKKASTSATVNKRKMIDTGYSSELEKTDTRVPKASRSCLDLNLPVEETDEGISLGDSDSESLSENSEGWLEELFSQVYKKIVFNPFDFDELANKIVKEVSSQFQSTVGSGVRLEIDEEVMLQILAAAWISDKREAVEDWLEKVLCRSFAEAQQKYDLTSQSVVKLVACEGVGVNEQAPGICLPAKINLN
ncbi:Double Clp-N motif-containing P-loop nucleoside triphosphate hydrolases superfamily protein, putative [Theobroma cacao]|uniref:Double Clp-N motif-containing P-loop nucleoside triphosphate hydrolases superfamily protein, putative n=1 Tax=Theobroma cacao TaxID=3641 RepID=A0A061GZV7_THECC|nr:Double Clp-N motif-containing P-loop nucleoside triphosphate hydrolases superfamily protein, putative [Theobroma cacao]